MNGADFLIWVAFLSTMLRLAKPKRPVPPVEIPTDQPKDDAERDKWIDLKKLEYTQTSDRYENIYRAIWQNFSYMAVLAGGILTFGSKALDKPTLIALALTPLVFWFLATFLPLDYYGDATRARVSQIEKEINQILFPGEHDPKVRHFIGFKDSKFTWRVQDAVVWTGRIVIIAWTLAVVLTAQHWTNEFRTQPRDMTNRLTAARDSLIRVTQRLDSVNQMLQITIQCLSVPPSPNRAPPIC